MTRHPARAPSQRQLRVGEEIRHVLAWVLERGELRDPVASAHSVTVTEVQVSADLRHARVFVMPLGGEDAEAVVLALRRARGFLRHRVGQQVRLRVVPELAFSIDESFIQAGAIERLLKDPRVARDLGEPLSGETDERGSGSNSNE